MLFDHLRRFLNIIVFILVEFRLSDPFADANAENSGAGSNEYVHIRVQQRNGRKSLTTVQGLKKEFSYNKILKDLKKEFCCNGTVVQDSELGQVIQLQSDQRKNVSTFLVQVQFGLLLYIFLCQYNSVLFSSCIPTLFDFVWIWLTGRHCEKRAHKDTRFLSCNRLRFIRVICSVSLYESEVVDFST